MGPTRKREVAAAAAITAAVSYPAMMLLYRWFPPITVFTGISLLVAAVLEAGWGRYVRTKVDGGEIGPGQLHPLTVARTVVIAKASAWMGALVLGFWLGVLGYLLPRRATLHVAAADTGGAVVAAASAAALVVAALWLQFCCRSPQGPDDAGPLAGDQAG